MYAFILASILVFGPDASAAVFRKGDVFTQGFPSKGLFQYRPDGTLVQSFEPSGRVFEGATVTQDGKLVTTHRLSDTNTTGINIFDSLGSESTFSTPEVSIPGDVSVFRDGTLAISNQSNSIVLYSQNGTFQGSITHSILDTGIPFGSDVGPDDTLWVALIGSGAARFSRNGSFLGSFEPGFSVRDISVDPINGTLWIPAPDGTLHNFESDGTELSSFMTAATQPVLQGVAVAPDHSIYITSNHSTELFHYSPDGTFLNSFEIPTRPLFVSVMLVPEPAGWYLLLLSFSILFSHRNDR